MLIDVYLIYMYTIKGGREDHIIVETLYIIYIYIYALVRGIVV